MIQWGSVIQWNLTPLGKLVHGFVWIEVLPWSNSLSSVGKTLSSSGKTCSVIHWDFIPHSRENSGTCSALLGKKLMMEIKNMERRSTWWDFTLYIRHMDIDWTFGQKWIYMNKTCTKIKIKPRHRIALKPAQLWKPSEN